MVAFTINSVTSQQPWKVIDAYSTDVSTSTALLASDAGKGILVRSIDIDFQKGDDDRWIKIYDGTDLQIGPVKTSSEIYKINFGEDSGLTFEEGVYIQTESDAQLHITMVYKIIPADI